MGLKERFRLRMREADWGSALRGKGRLRDRKGGREKRERKKGRKGNKGGGTENAVGQWREGVEWEGKRGKGKGRVG